MSSTPHQSVRARANILRRIIPLVIILCVIGVAAGCASGPVAEVEHRWLIEDNLGVGNVYVHVSNQGDQEALALNCRIRDRTGWRHWRADAEVRFGAHDYHTFIFVLPPGEYVIELDDGIRKNAWSMPFDVAAKRVHLDISYWLFPLELNVYRSRFKGEATDDIPVVF